MKLFSCPDIAYVLFTIKQYLRRRVHVGAKSMQFVTRGCKSALMLPHLTLQRNCLLASVQRLAPLSLQLGFYYLLSLKNAHGKMLHTGWFQLFWCWLLWQRRHKEERCSSTYSTSWNRYISADSEISCFLALYRSLSTIAILPPCWKSSPCVDGKITTQKSAKSKTKKYSAKVFLPHFLLSPSSDWCH